MKRQEAIAIQFGRSHQSSTSEMKMPMGSGSILLRSTSSPRTSNSMFGRSEGLEPAACSIDMFHESTEGEKRAPPDTKHPHAHQEPLPKSLFAFWPERTAPWKREPRRIQSTLAF
jgi:hypothetical protein